MPTPSRPRKWPIHGWVGLSLVAVFWPLNWLLPGPRTLWGFFPLWLGYSLSVDALVRLRKGSSILSRSRAGFVGLFLFSIPAWWLFELFNRRTENWIYLGGESLTPLQYALLASLSFSTVMPSVFGTAELAGTLGCIRGAAKGPALQPSGGLAWCFFALGWVMLAMVLLWPLYFFPCVWLSVFFILEPINHWLGNSSLLRSTQSGDWRPVLSLALGCLTCGFFWEMWNFWSYPKWVYRVPFVDFGKVFEMPVLGYGGYIPFALELFALYSFMTGLLRIRSALWTE